MALLALDLSTRAGWACGNPWRGLPRMEVGSFHVPKEGTVVERNLAFKKEFHRFLRERPDIDIAGVEIPLKGTGKRTVVETDGMGNKSFHVRSAGGEEARILLWTLNVTANNALDDFGIRARQIGVKEWRKDMFGNGNIAGIDSKRKAKAMLIEWGVDVKNQDEAEAGMMLAWMNRRITHLRLELGMDLRGG